MAACNRCSFNYSPLFFAAILFGVCVSLVSLPKAAHGECASTVKDIPVQQTVASASFWGNLRNRPGTINYESTAIFNTARDKADTLQRPDNFCPTGCSVSHRAVLFFRSAPRKVLDYSSDQDYCAQLLARTEQKPIQYQTLEIKSVDDLNHWIGDLSQGKGTLGKDLYQKCDRACSPRFEYTVAKKGNTPSDYLVRASVLCGQPRDKDDNTYDLHAFFRWTCVPE